MLLSGELRVNACMMCLRTWPCQQDASPRLHAGHVGSDKLCRASCIQIDFAKTQGPTEVLQAPAELLDGLLSALFPNLTFPTPQARQGEVPWGRRGDPGESRYEGEGGREGREESAVERPSRVFSLPAVTMIRQDDGGLVISNRITLNKLTSNCLRVPPLSLRNMRKGAKIFRLSMGFWFVLDLKDAGNAFVASTK